MAWYKYDNNGVICWCCKACHCLEDYEGAYSMPLKIQNNEAKTRS